MNDTLALLAELMQSQGIRAVAVVAGIVIVLFNTDKIGAAFERLLCRFVPSYEARAQQRAEERKHRQSLEQAGREAREQERTDTILVFKDLLLEYRTRLDDNEVAINRARQDLLEVVRVYERRDAQIVEVLRDMSEMLRAQTGRIDRLTMQMENLVKEKDHV